MSAIPALLAISALGYAQDPREVKEPVFPPACTKLTAQLSSGATPGTLSDETLLDTARIQDAMNSCPATRLVNRLTISGLASDSNASGVHIKSDVSRGGLVENSRYENICLEDVRYPIGWTPSIRA